MSNLYLALINSQPMKHLYLMAIIAIFFSCGSSEENPDNIDFTTPFEKSNGTQTATYEEIMDYYKNLDEAYTSIRTYEMGRTDSNKPLTLITYSPNRTFESEFSKDADLRRILINNGIHPGEPDGIDATMMLLRDLAQGKIEIPDNIWVGAIAVYNIGGALNRNSTSRTNQNGPESYGFRGNAKNYDLNRDFIKADTKNADAFAEIFHLVQPDVFVDTHVSNGADYQYTLTHLFTQHNKLGGVLGTYLHEDFQPKIEEDLKNKKWEITPYVNVFNRTPEQGFSQFMDYPRYSTGYTALWNTLGLMIETHMLKPYKQRVEGTNALLQSIIHTTAKESEKIKALRADAFNAFAKAETYPIEYVIDSTKTSTLQFLGYEGTYVESEITGKPRLKYHRDHPFTKPVTYYDYFKPTKEIDIPKAYIVPHGWRDIIVQLYKHDIEYKQLKKDSTMMVEVYHIEDYQTRRNAYEGHYPHYDTKVRIEEKEITFKKGDYVIPTTQDGIRYLLETLEPEAPDSFFNWNYFDTILQQKEGFSPYVWEDKAADFLAGHPEIQSEFDAKKANEPSFAQNWYAQLDWIHKQSPNYEQVHLRYPITRVRR